MKKLLAAILLLPSLAIAQVGTDPAVTIPPGPPGAVSAAPAVPACSISGPCQTLGRSWAVGLSLDPWQSYAWGGRDIYNGKFAAGYGYELVDFYRNGKNVAYLSGMHVFNSVEEGRGAIGAVLGIRPINTINAVASLVRKTPEDLINLPPWLNDISNWTSLDIGYAYKMQKALPGESRNEWLIGGKVQRRFDLSTPH